MAVVNYHRDHGWGGRGPGRLPDHAHQDHHQHAAPGAYNLTKTACLKRLNDTNTRYLFNACLTTCNVNLILETCPVTGVEKGGCQRCLQYAGRHSLTYRPADSTMHVSDEAVLRIHVATHPFHLTGYPFVSKGDWPPYRRDCQRHSRGGLHVRVQN